MKLAAFALESLEQASKVEPTVLVVSETVAELVRGYRESLAFRYKPHCPGCSGGVHLVKEPGVSLGSLTARDFSLALWCVLTVSKGFRGGDDAQRAACELHARMAKMVQP
jgi:hypothetical protein